MVCVVFVGLDAYAFYRVNPKTANRRRGVYAKAYRRWACLKPLRNALHLFACQSALQEAWALHYYQQKRATGKSHAMAVRALANVWVRIIYAMWRAERLYQAQTFIGAQQQHQRQTA